MTKRAQFGERVPTRARVPAFASTVASLFALASLEASIADGSTRARRRDDATTTDARRKVLRDEADEARAGTGRD